MKRQIVYVLFIDLDNTTPFIEGVYKDEKSAEEKAELFLLNNELEPTNSNGDKICTVFAQELQ